MNLTVFCGEGVGCLKQEKILTGEYTMLHCHAGAVHSVSIFLLLLSEALLTLVS